MRYEVKDECVTFFLDNPKRESNTVRTQSFLGTGLSADIVTPLFNCLIEKFLGQSLNSQEKVTSAFLRPFFSFFKSKPRPWPNSSSQWQIFVLEFFQYFLTDSSWTDASSSLRMISWQSRISELLEFFKSKDLIPSDIKIPRIKIKKLQSQVNSQPLLAHSVATPTDINTAPQKLLVNVDFGMTDADYLISIEKSCRHLVELIRDVCSWHWNGLMRDMETGRRLAAQISDSEINKAAASANYEVPHPTRGNPLLLASPNHSEGHTWALALIHRLMASGTDIDCVSINTLRSSPFFPNQVLSSRKQRHWYHSLDSLTSMTQSAWQRLPRRARLYRFAGLLSNLDAAAACCLLTIEHPEFTSESLQDAKLLNVRGKPYLLLSDSVEHSILSLDKPRAGKRKSVVLTEASQKLISEIIRATSPAREILRRAGDKTWRYLFIGARQFDKKFERIGVVEGQPKYLSGPGRIIGLATLYPELARNGLKVGCFDYRRLRSTLGVIRWFETGSIVEMSRRLGNTRKVAIEHYLPPALLHAWNTRIVRRFQNTLIVLAAHEEPYLLEVTDFSNMADLQHFIAQLIVDYPAKTSPLSDEVQQRLASPEKEAQISMSSRQGLLNVRLSPQSLGYLYAYSDLAFRMLSEDELDRVDVLSGLAPRQFTDMSTLLRHAVENESLHATLRESLDVALLKQVHGEALVLQQNLDMKFANLAIRHCWAD